MPDPLKYNKKFDELNEEEKELLEINKQSIADFVEQSSSISDVNYATRNAHAKTYAVAKGTFWVDKNIPEWVQPFFDNEKFDLTIRFSNAQLKIKNSRKDIPAYGFAIQIKDEKGGLLANFPLVNFPLFPINSVSTFLKLFTAINRSYIKKGSSLFSIAAQMIKIIPSFVTGSFFKNILKLFQKRNDFLLSFDYYSVGAYRLGDYMIKIKLEPQSVDKNIGKKQNIKKTLRNYFQTTDFTADIFIQFCYDLKDQPINKLNVEWKNSPYLKIGEVKINKDSLLDPRICSNELLSFNPFESKAIFQPVGKIQKLRDEAYKVSVQTRRKINKLLHGKGTEL
ncbi:catalase [Chryseobacterium indologenes]|uniref:catalase n=1 Tax=Chryseobacterium indologenes TaxID=253 RepID=UPI000BFC9FF3|nr:catalase [Chryseobacterium indologenes]ATN04080.1 catalase [Chryseobacterium indologenes]AYY83256.1 catalase [Chryseobacterium indologenes]QIX80163.1 catalase [Chryseobacterium indologenes]UDQ53810.1 catalase [Chryseobacterium indologenes]